MSSPERDPFWISFSFKAVLSPDSIFLIVALTIAPPEPSCSRQPLPPQGQAGPSTSNIICPISPATPSTPVNKRPLRIIAPPTPVPIKTATQLLLPLPAPNLHSP